MNKFNFLSEDGPGYEIRIVGDQDNPKWVAADICTVLDIDTSQTRRLDEDEKELSLVQTKGGNQKMVCINSKGLKRLISTSRKPNARKIAQQLGIEVFVTHKEQNNLSVIIAAFKHIPIVTQFFISGYRIDLYFPEHRIAVECDA